MNIASDIKALELFNEKAEKLMTLSFVQKILSEDSGHQMTFDQEGVSAKRFGPDSESVEAFVLTFRFFVQDNEPSSIRKTTDRYRRLHRDSLIPKDLLDNVEDARNKLLNYLGSNTRLIVGQQYGKTPAKAITYQEVFDVFMWGGLAHANRQHKERFDSWSKGEMQFLFPMLENCFILVLSSYLRVIWYMRGQNEKVLSKLNTNQV